MSTQHTREHSEQDFLNALTAVAKLTKYQIDEFTMELFSEAVRPFGWGNAISALKHHMVKSRSFPTLNEILEIVAPHTVAEVTEVDEAAVAANRIWEAIEKFGDRKTGPAGDAYQKQIEYIGELGWEAVKNSWANICAGTRLEDRTHVIREWKAQIKGIALRSKAGLPSAPSLPRPKNQQPDESLPSAVSGLLDSAAEKFSMSADTETTYDW